MSCVGYVLGSLGAKKILLFNSVAIVYSREYLIHNDLNGNDSACDLLQAGCGDLHSDRSAREEYDSAELLDSTLYLTDIRAEIFSKEGKHLVREGYRYLLCLFLYDSNSQLKIRRLNVGDKSPFKSRLESVLKRLNVLRRTVGRENYLLVLLVESVEGVEKLLLSRGLTCDKLYVVDQKYITAAVLLVEFVHLLL